MYVRIYVHPPFPTLKIHKRVAAPIGKLFDLLNSGRRGLWVQRGLESALCPGLIDIAWPCSPAKILRTRHK